MKRRAKRDGNHNKLADLFRTLGCSVIDMVDTGIPGWPDTCIGCIGVTHLCELKNPDTAYGRAGFNGNQTAFNLDWRGEKVELVATEADVITLVNKWRGKCTPAKSADSTATVAGSSSPMESGP